MWTRIANFILGYRLYLLLLLTVVTGLMAYLGRNVTITTKFAELVPKHAEDYKVFESFKEHFGQDANAMIIGYQDSSLYNNVEVFNDYYSLCDSINSMKEIGTVLAIPQLPNLKAHKRKRIFYSEKIFSGPVTSKEELTTKINTIKNIKFYDGQIFNSKTGASIIYIPIKKEYVDLPVRKVRVKQIMALAQEFGDKHNMRPAFAGLPYLRTVKTATTETEIKIFFSLSILITALILYVFFRSLTSVFFPILVIVTVVVWTYGTMGVLEYQITSLTGLIPTILVVIGIPNAVYLINKFHQEFAHHGDKIKALTNVIKRIGVVTLITNFTTAIGFLVLVSADITILKEFGVVAGINVLSTFIISIILIPVVFSYLPEPSTKQLKHLDFGLINGVLSKINSIVSKHRKFVYIIAALIVLVASYGVWKVKAVSYMTDDMPEDDPAKISLQFLEKNFKGTLPLEIIINTGDSTWYKHEENIYRINEFEKFLGSQEHLSRSLSIVQITKALKQAYYQGHPNYYDIPTSREIKSIGEFLVRTQKKAEKTGNSSSISFGGFNDKSSSGQVRISIKCADIGSKALNHLINDSILPKAKEIFKGVKIKGREPKDYPVQITGTSFLFLQGNTYLIQNLKQSLVLAVVLIAIIMAFLFKSTRMIIISLIPNIIPLVVTGAIMGYFGVALKPSTALIFSIAFGISVDDSIHFLAKYRQELYLTNFDVKKAVSLAIKETGASMMYTSIILFFGFIIFAFSSATSIVMLGILTSTTLLLAMLTNLIVLPTLLISFDKVSSRKLKK